MTGEATFSVLADSDTTSWPEALVMVTLIALFAFMFWVMVR